MTTRRSHTDLEDQAIDWLVRLGSGRAGPTDRAAFAAWRAADPAHEAAARAAERLWHDLGHTRAAAGHAEGGAAVVPLARPGRAPARRATRRAVIGGALAASLALLVVAGVPPRDGADHVTAVGERAEIALPDGSVVALNTDTRLSVRYGGSERRIVLHQGEALFDVVADAARPFVVEAGAATARAVGTAYAVSRDDDAVGITVAEGLVEVAADGAPVRLGAGQHVEVAGGSLAPVRPVDARADTAWRRGRLIANRRPLGEVMAEVARHQHGAIVVAESLRGLAVTAVFDLDDRDALFDLIEQTLPVTVLRLPFLTVIHAA